MIVKLLHDCPVKMKEGAVILVDDAEAERLKAFGFAEEVKEPKAKAKKKKGE